MLTKKFAAAAAAATMALGAISPMVANAQVIGFGGGFGGGSSLSLPQLFVLGSLFSGQYGNGIVGGTSLGGLLMLNQIFSNGAFNGGFGGGWWY